MQLRDRVWEALRGVRYPGYGRDIVSFGLVQNVTASGDAVGIALRIRHLPPSVQEVLEREVRRAVLELGGVRTVEVVRVAPAGARPTPPTAADSRPRLASRVFGIASGKGGVGKSSVTTNPGRRAGPGRPAGGRTGRGRVRVQHRPHAGGTAPAGSPAGPTGARPPRRGPGGDHGHAGGCGGGRDLAGPLLHKALRTFLHEVAWEDLDVLLLDLPPGTGDVALTVAQDLPDAEWLVVTTPQPAAVEVALRAARMAEKVRLRVTGVVENFSWCPPDPAGERLYPFGRGGGREAADRLGVPLLAEIPLDPSLRECADRGEPVVWAHPARDVSQRVRALARVLVPQAQPVGGR